MTATDTLGVLRDYLFGDALTRAVAAGALADRYEEAGDQSAADSLRAAPSLTAVPNLLALARPLTPLQVGELCGRLLGNTALSPGVVEAMLRAMSADAFGDFCAWVPPAADAVEAGSIDGYS